MLNMVVDQGIQYTSYGNTESSSMAPTSYRTIPQHFHNHQNVRQPVSYTESLSMAPASCGQQFHNHQNGRQSLSYTESLSMAPASCGQQFHNHQNGRQSLSYTESLSMAPASCGQQFHSYQNERQSLSYTESLSMAPASCGQQFHNHQNGRQQHFNGPMYLPADNSSTYQHHNSTMSFVHGSTYGNEQLSHPSTPYWGYHTQQPNPYGNHVAVNFDSELQKKAGALSSNKIPVDSPILLKLSQEVKEWKFLARYLDLKENVIEEIDQYTVPNKLRDKALRVFKEWINSAIEPTWRALGDALLEAEYVLLHEYLSDLVKIHTA